jgi:hypothetical protein
MYMLKTLRMQCSNASMPNSNQSGRPFYFYAEIPELDNTLDPNNCLKSFRDILPQREITPLLAKLAYDVFKIFDVTPMLCVEAPVPRT